MEWSSYYLYPNSTLDEFLIKEVKPFLESNVWGVKNTRAFFVRMHDESGEHIRLRIGGAPEWLQVTLEPRLKEHFEKIGCKIKEVAYEPEVERYGGVQNMNIAELQFHLSTWAVLHLLQTDKISYNDKLFQAIRLHIFSAHTLGMNTTKVAAYFMHLCNLWLPIYFVPVDKEIPEHQIVSDVTANFEMAFSKQKGISQTFLGLWESLNLNAQEKEDLISQKWYAGNKLLLQTLKSEADKEKILASLIHMTNNRLGITNQDEVFVNYLIGKSFA